MKKLCFPLLLLTCAAHAQVTSPLYHEVSAAELYRQFHQPPAAAAPWVFWHWVQGAVSREGITADLMAMKEAGIAGAYLMTIKDAANPPVYQPAMRQLTPEWWEMMVFAMKEAKRIGVRLSMVASDGFSLAGGPWITPDLAMQKVVYSSLEVEGGKRFQDTLPLPETYKGYYRDIAVYAYPSQEPAITAPLPVITSSRADGDVSGLASKNNTKTFSSNDPCWIQYSYARPFTCRAIVIRTNGNNYQAHRLLIQVSDDGVRFRNAGRLQAPRHGWQDTDADVTHAIEPVTAKYFRFVYDKEGTEPGSEDLDAAKWKPTLKLKGIELLTAPRLHQYEGKSGLVWRISPRTTEQQLPDSLCVPIDKVIPLSGKVNARGQLVWEVPAGRWTILRMGHTATGHTNATGGAGIGLECDRFNPAAIELQFNNWFREARRRGGPELASNLTRLFLESWESGSQNWSPVFRDAFQRLRGYDPLPYLPAMAGIPVGSVAIAEGFLYDVRQTIAQLISDTCFATFAKLAHDNGCELVAESVAPTMMSDGMLHFSKVDMPMGEFWFNSPTHDKPNDMLDAISGAHIYGKPVIQAEAFTTVRMAWNEHPGSLKTIQDRNYALGLNSVAYHVFVQNPWTDRKPGSTLDGVGLYFQRDQTWWKPGVAWVDYARRCQSLLQLGKPVADVAVFTGEELPRRSILPDRLVTTLPGIMGADRVREEKLRLANVGQPLRVKPDGVTHAANMADPENWTDPLRGYAYDSFNEDAILRLATVHDGRIVLPGGASYGVLVLPVPGAATPDGGYMNPAVAKRIGELVKAGATVIAGDRSLKAPGLHQEAVALPVVTGKGKLLKAPYNDASFAALGIAPDLIMKDSTGKQAKAMAWTHRTAADFDLYFVANQLDKPRILELSLRETGRLPELWDPVTGDTMVARNWKVQGGRTVLPVKLEANASVFVVLRKKAVPAKQASGNNYTTPKVIQTLQGGWKVQFDTAFGGPAAAVPFSRLQDWSKHELPGVKYYSGTAVYTYDLEWNQSLPSGRTWLQLGEVANLAAVKLNGVDCGISWTAPYRVDITKALKKGMNKLEISVTNTWANRLIGDHILKDQKPVTWTTAPFRLEGKPLEAAGLLGPVTIAAE
ncbi:glycosyl hydrolase [Filimonas effusa]|uniref:DNA-binding protein n=1 Tax=Filimonas effusa TaxID=2508721 RepID=A0A4Q1DBC7_9BACT|nr:glycosyl hydrolase [Filimonas effusa]RXK86737.1 DNA-binding protein [Filimonas effusa]